ncbi:AAA family ATPase [Limnothrix sp. PR1529]|uniref:AAA family ATPase n=1 Tax=Limnothrix sp. PR1529 TaxID=1704291 RepID=UPI00081EB9BB|nr:AAA family ATPase [Limnothrix sp. PR1529]OCQ92530.1 hypothetical protein BCR12_17390 [Limnothrix sp. P13C2]
MYIKRLALENYRGFQNLNIDFPKENRNLNVFVGINGAGKSSILDALSVALQGFVYSLYSLQDENVEWSLRDLDQFDVHPDDIQIDSDHFFVAADWGDDYKTIAWSISYQQYLRQLSLFDLADVDKQANADFLLSIHAQELSDYFKSVGVQSEKFNSSKLIDTQFLPIIAYYRTRRIEVYSSYNQRVQSPIYSLQSPYGDYPNSFSISSQYIASLSEWFTSEEDIENAKRLTSNIEYRRPNLQVVRSALETFAEQMDCSFLQKVQAARLQKNLWNPRTLLTVQKESIRLKINQLSDGERVLLALVLDIARRMAVFNPFTNTPEEALQGKGIILIDEIDLHLHPTWQRMILPALTTTFPNCQFIVTTHSPQVISSVPSESIFVLDGGSVIYNPGYTHGRDANSILRELMDVSDRMPKIQEKIDECFRLVDDENLEEAKIKLKALNEILGNNDPDIIHLKTMIDFLEENPSYPELTS